MVVMYIHIYTLSLIKLVLRHELNDIISKVNFDGGFIGNLSSMKIYTDMPGDFL